MAIIEQTFDEDFDVLLSKIESGMLKGNISAAIEEKSDFSEGSARCSVRLFSRFSLLRNRQLSMSVTLFQVGDSPVQLSAMAIGEDAELSDNRIGEAAFLKKLIKILDLDVYY